MCCVDNVVTCYTIYGYNGILFILLNYEWDVIKTPKNKKSAGTMPVKFAPN